MAQKSPPIGQRDFSKGVWTNISTSIAPPNSVKHALNFVFDEDYGNAKLRRGLTIVGSQLVGESNNILGLFNFRDRDASNHALLAAVNVAGDATASIINSATGATLATGLTASSIVRFEQFLDEVAFQNGTTAPQSWTGTGSFAATGGNLNIANMPIGIDIKNFKDRMCVLTAGGILRRSSIPTSPNFTSISWTSGNDSIPIDPDSTSYTGAGIGLEKVGGLLLILKERAVYSFNGSATQADFLYNVGCSSRQGHTTGGGYCFFFNPDGIWMTKGGDPLRISRPVQIYIDNMDTANYSSVAMGANGKYVWCSIGDVTIDGTTYSDVVLRWTINTQEWAVFSYAVRLTAFSMYINGNASEIAVGDETARVYRLDVGNTDNGTAINYELVTQDLEFGSLGILKDIHDKLMIYTKKASSPMVQIRMDEGDWKDIDVVSHDVEELSIQEQLNGNMAELRIIGSSSGEQMTFKGYEFPKTTLESYQA